MGLAKRIMEKDMSVVKDLKDKVVNYMQRIGEVLITFGGKAYPKFGQIIILSGGAGSGKDFVRNKILGVEGIVLDVDRLKELILLSSKYKAKAKEEFGIDVSKLDLKKKEDVSKLHDIVSVLKINDKKLKALFTSIKTANKDLLPNIIFNVTLKDMVKFHNIIRNVLELGYEKENVSLVWVLNTIDVALAQNKSRSRVVADEILMSTHDGASYTMNKIINMGKQLSSFLNGDIYIAFNQAKVDTEIQSQSSTSKPGVFKAKKSKPFYIKNAEYFQLKKKGKAIMKYEDISKDVIAKIKRYVPNAEIWK